MTEAEKIIKSGLRSVTRLNRKLYSKIKSGTKKDAKISFIGKKVIEEVQSQLFEYDENKLNEVDDFNEYQSLNDLNPQRVYWLNFHGIHEVELFENVGKILDLDKFTVRQIVDTTQRPKVEEYPHYLFFSIKSILEKETNHGEIEIEQLSFVLGNGYLISFQEKVGDHFGHIRHRIRENLGIVRKKGSDFLLYLLLDAILDNHFETIETVNDEMEVIEGETFNDPKQHTLLKLEEKKKTTGIIKKSLLPLREALNKILNEKTNFIQPENMKYFRDLQNTCSNAIEEVDFLYQGLDSLSNIYFSALSQKMNETMKVLTLVATIFIPLSFIAGVYGMNFDFMPELHMKYGYFIVLGIMLFVLVGMIFYFRKKKWL